MELYKKNSQHFSSPCVAKYQSSLCKLEIGHFWTLHDPLSELGQPKDSCHVPVELLLHDAGVVLVNHADDPGQHDVCIGQVLADQPLAAIFLLIIELIIPFALVI